MSSITKLPTYPLTSLSTAQFTTTTQAFTGPTIIDFWTTKCTRCPSALDELNTLASSPKYKNVAFASICCDSCDGAREIIDADEIPKWENIHHYYMGFEYKEMAKKVLGFTSVPFLVVLNEHGEIVQMGSKKSIVFENIPGMVRESVSPKSVVEETGERSFAILDLDF